MKLTIKLKVKTMNDIAEFVMERTRDVALASRKLEILTSGFSVKFEELEEERKLHAVVEVVQINEAMGNIVRFVDSKHRGFFLVQFSDAMKFAVNTIDLLNKKSDELVAAMGAAEEHVFENLKDLMQ